MPKTTSWAANAWNMSFSVATGLLSVTEKVAPWKITIVPRVVMNELTRNFATRMPFSSPMAAPGCDSDQQRDRQARERSMMIEMAPESTRFEPIERSKNPAIMSSVMPMDRMPLMDMLVTILRKFS